MLPQMIIIAGFPGVGKSTIAKKLQNDFMQLNHTPCILIDKDEVTKGITSKLHEMLGLPANDRESALHKNAVRPLAHEILYNAAKCGLDSNLTVLLDAPFEQYIQEESWYSSLQKRFGLNPYIVWVEIPKEQEYQQLKDRNRDLDAWKLSHFEEYYSAREGMKLQVPQEFLYRSNGDYNTLWEHLSKFIYSSNMHKIRRH